MAATAIVVPVPEAQPLVGPWHGRLTEAGAAGMPPHLTLLYPFVEAAALVDEHVERARAALASFPPAAVAFRSVDVFAGPRAVVYLVPDPDAPFRAMTEALAAAFPDHPPYAGVHVDVLPHLTVAEVPVGCERRLRAELERCLPFAARLSEAWLYAQDAGRWRPRSGLPLEGGR